MIIFSNPSNPTGLSITGAEMRRLLEAITAETILIFDEAYYEYAVTDPSYPDFLSMLRRLASPWLMLRTFSKAYGLAGLRVGYGIASDARLVDLMDRVRSPFNVNRVAQAAAIAAFQEMSYVCGCVSRTIAERGRVRAALAAVGYWAPPSRANFLFVDAGEDASGLAPCERSVSRRVEGSGGKEFPCCSKSKRLNRKPRGLMLPEKFARPAERS